MAVLTKYIIIYKLGENKHILINTLTSALDLIDDETREKIEKFQENNMVENLDDELYQKLKQRGYIFENKQKEQDVICRLNGIDRKMKNSVTNKSYTICPTMGCNLRCTYCFEEGNLHKNFQKMSDEQLDVILKFILKNKNTMADNNQSVQIKLFGGEPLLISNKELIEKILKVSYENKIEVAIITNGTTIQEYYELLKKYKDIIQIQITVDGDRETHNKRRIRADGKGTFDEINKNIELILKLGIKLQYRINIDKENIYNIKKLEDYIKDKGWLSYENFIPYASPVLNLCGIPDENSITEHELYNILLQENLYGETYSFLKRIVSPCIGYLENFFSTGIKPWKMTYCEATTGNDLCFAPDGMITTCLTYAGTGKYNVGTFDENGVNIDKKKLEIWTERNVLKLEKCSECKYAFLCGGGCPVMALERNKDINKNVCSDVKDTVYAFVQHKFQCE